MKVNPSGSQAVQGSEVSNTRQTGRTASTQDSKKTSSKPATQSEKAPTDGVRTEISDKGKEFARAKSIAAEAPDVREDKVADIKRRIQEGSYKVNSGAVADRLVNEHLNKISSDE